MRRSKAAIALVAGTLLLAFVVPGGAAAAGGTGGTLEGPTWVLASYAVNGTMTTVPSAVYVDASFKSGTVNGFGGCNAYSGSYSASGSSLTFGQLASTLMLCAGPAGNVEAAYFAALGKSASYTATATSLTIFDSAGNQLLLYSAGSPAAVTGTTWHLLAYNNGNQAVVSAIAGTDPTATFGTDGTVSGNATCNQYSGPYTTSGSTIKVGPLTSTMMACADQAQMNQEAQYLTVLQKVATYQVQAGHLEMRDAGGAIQVEYTSEAPAPTPAASAPAATPAATSAPQPPTTTSSTPGGNVPLGILLVGACAAALGFVLIRRRVPGER